MTIRKLSFVGVLTALSCLLLPPAVRPAGAQTAAQTPALAARRPRAARSARRRWRRLPPRPPPAGRSVKAPFLWRIEGPVPSYLYGTIHVPDAQVTNLPPAVEQAFAVLGRRVHGNSHGRRAPARR